MIRRRRFCRVISLTMLGIFSISALLASPINAITASQKKILNYSISYYNECGTVNTSSSEDNTASGVATSSTAEWVEKYGQWAFDDGKAYGVPYEVILAQGAFESGWGSSYNAINLHNFFGITATSSQPHVTINGRTWYKWDDDRSGWRGYAEYITSAGYYDDALNNYAHDPYNFLKAILDIYAPESDGNYGYYEQASSIMAGIIQYIDDNDLFPPSSEVEYDTTRPSSSDSSTSSSSGDVCTDSTSGGNGDIAKTAISLAWEDDDHHDEIKPEYLTALEESGFDTSLSYAQDCGHFVATVMHYSGVDEDFPAGGTSNMQAYMEESDKYEEIENLGNTSNLKPGDIFVVNQGSGEGASGHIFIYIGEQDGGWQIASASLGSRTGNLGEVVKFSDSRGEYKIFRFKG